MKKLLILILFCLLLCLCAQAEESTYYTLNEDIYYHIHANCGGAQDMVPLSKEAAKEFQKYPCPVCGPIKDDISAKSVVRGGTIVSRIPQSWLDDPAKTTRGVFADSSNTSHHGNEVHARLSELLHGQKYTDFMAEYDTNGRAETTVRVPDIIWDNGELIMNERHFGDAYYIVFRPKNAFEDGYTTYVRFFEHDLCLENDVLYETVGREWNDPDFKINLDRADGKAIYNGTSGDLQISVFHEMDTNIAVITEKNADKNRISRVHFTIDGKNTGIEMSGYMEGKNAVYCCVLTDAELDLIKNGAEIHIPRADISEKADFEGTDYAIVKSGDFYGIVDRNHQFVLDAKYGKINRSVYDHIFVASEAETYHMVIFDAAEKRIIATLDEDDYQGNLGWGLWPEVQNQAVFTVNIGQFNRIYDMKTGELISELGEYGSGKLNGVFEGPVYGDPDCLVSRRDDGMRLMDYQGNFRSAAYPRITPLIWNGEEGLFLTANMENEYEIGTDGHENAPDWRCGLIDQSGNVLAEMEYVRAAVISSYAVQLRDADGNAYDCIIG